MGPHGCTPWRALLSWDVYSSPEWSFAPVPSAGKFPAYLSALASRLELRTGGSIRSATAGGSRNNAGANSGAPRGRARRCDRAASQSPHRRRAPGGGGRARAPGAAALAPRCNPRRRGGSRAALLVPWWYQTAGSLRLSHTRPSGRATWQRCQASRNLRTCRWRLGERGNVARPREICAHVGGSWGNVATLPDLAKFAHM